MLPSRTHIQTGRGRQRGCPWRVVGGLWAGLASGPEEYKVLLPTPPGVMGGGVGQAHPGLRIQGPREQRAPEKRWPDPHCGLHTEVGGSEPGGEQAMSSASEVLGGASGRACQDGAEPWSPPPTPPSRRPRLDCSQQF